MLSIYFSRPDPLQTALQSAEVDRLGENLGETGREQVLDKNNFAEPYTQLILNPAPPCLICLNLCDPNLGIGLIFNPNKTELLR